jgi:hypothetical protein
LFSFGRTARIALVSATICMTVGASGVLATMTWQVPGDANAATEGGLALETSPSLIMTAANAYIDTRAARMALQTAAPQVTAANVASAAKVEPAKNMASFSQFERKCLKKISKRRNAKLVHVECSPLQDEQAETIAAADAPAAVRKMSRRAPSAAFARQDR